MAEERVNEAAEAFEGAYMRGSRAAWRAMLGECLKNLDYNDDPEAMRLRWILEREDAVAQLRMLCDDFGDNDWPDSLYLGDAIEKHLGNYLEAEE